MFNLGDLVVGNAHNGYVYTSNRALMRVIDIHHDMEPNRDRGEGNIRVAIIAHDWQAYANMGAWWVDSNDFNRTTEEEYFAMYPNAYKADNYNPSVVYHEPPAPEKPETNVFEAFIKGMNPYQFTEKQANDFINKGSCLLEYDLSYDDDYHPTSWGMRAIWNEVSRNKVNLATLFSRHPNWDDEKLSISFMKEIKARKDKEAIDVFYDFLRNRAREYARENNLTWRDEKYNALFDAIDCVYNICTPEIDEFYAKRFNSLAEPFMPEFVNPKTGEVHKKKLGIQKGMKTTKAVQKFFALFGFDKYKEIRTNVFYSDNGDRHERTKDYGWAEYFSHIYSDEINSKDKKYRVYISINPLDFYTMSEGNGWTSCHSPLKEHDGFDGEYNGCYCSGPESYMMDTSSFLVFTNREEDQTDLPYHNDKINRCVFQFAYDKLIQGRCYPDGRDGGEKSLATQLRDIVLDVISECLGMKYDWRTEVGQVPSSMTNSFGTHYRDYRHYSDCSLSTIKVDGCKTNTKMVPIGHTPICPECGNEHNTEDDLICPSCRGLEVCEKCGCTIDRGDAIYDEDTGNYYCDYECAERDEVYYCDNVGEYHSEHVYYDSFRGVYFYDNWGDHIETEDGNCYENEENAERDGYRLVTSGSREGEWHSEDYVYYCPICDETVHYEDYDEEHDCCCACAEELDDNETAIA